MLVYATLAERFAVIGHDDDHGIFHTARLLHPVKQPTELMIVVSHFAVVVIGVGCAEVEAVVLTIRAMRICGVKISREWTILGRFAEQVNGRIDRTGEGAI